jgi:serine/threonine protein kinase
VSPPFCLFIFFVNNLSVGKDFVRQLLVFDPDQRMSLISAQEHPWLVHHKPTYEFQSPAAPEGQTITRTASLNSGFSSSAEAPAHPLLSRAVTVDPYADDPYADGYQFPQPPVRTLRTPPPAPLDPIAELSPGLPGLRRGPRQSTPPPESAMCATANRPMLRTANNEQRPNPIDPPTMAYVQDSTDEMLYGPTPTPDLRAGPVAPKGGAQKRTFAEMHIDGSSPLTSIASSPPPPPKKSNKRKTVAKKTTTGTNAKPDAPARAGRKAKVQKQEDPGVENPPALRRSNRPARPARH